MRKIIIIGLSILLVLGSVLMAKYFIANKKKPKQRINKIVKTVFTQNVENKTIPLVITTNGNLIAKNKIELFSEVQGVLKSNIKEFKSGTNFNKGETILRINSDEFYANLQAQKSNLFNVITAVMPDIRLDFPNEYNKWQYFVNNFDLNKSIPELPKTNSNQEKFFISGRGIYTSYYNVKNLEVKLSKYAIKAPFKGILTEALVNRGTLIRPGQKLGEFINPSIYEIGVSVKSEYKDLLKIGKQVKLSNLEKTTNWNGKVVRINGKVDTSTQSIKVFIEVSGSNLKEGQYLEIDLEAKAQENAFVVSRSLLIDNSKLFVVKDSKLEVINVNPVFENLNTMVVTGIPNGTQLLSKVVPGAHQGMLVKVFNDTKNK